MKCRLLVKRVNYIPLPRPVSDVFCFCLSERRSALLGTARNVDIRLINWIGKRCADRVTCSNYARPTSISRTAPKFGRMVSSNCHKFIFNAVWLILKILPFWKFKSNYGKLDQDFLKLMVFNVVLSVNSLICCE